MSSKTKLDIRFTDILWGQEPFQRVSAEASYQHHLNIGDEASYQHHLLHVSTVVEGTGWCHVSIDCVLYWRCRVLLAPVATTIGVPSLAYPLDRDKHLSHYLSLTPLHSS